MYPELGGKIELDATTGSDFRGDGTTTREGALEGTLTCKVVEFNPNGNLVVLGWKEVRSNKETQYLSLSGMVEIAQDNESDNTIPSDLIAEARIEYTGSVLWLTNNRLDLVFAPWITFGTILNFDYLF